MNEFNESQDDSPRSTIRKIVWTVVAVLLAFAIVQSITITPAIRGRIVDKETGKPVPDAVVAALWELEIHAIVETLPGGSVKIAETVSDNNGQFAFETAVIFHWPLLPFSWFMRSESDMPMLVVVKEEYYAKKVTNDIFGTRGPPHRDSGFLSLRSSSLENGLIRLSRLPERPDVAAVREFEYRLESAASSVGRATAYCKLRPLCQDRVLSRTEEMVARSWRSLHRNTN